MERAWIDQKEKIISFHHIEAGKLLEAEEAAFWQKIFSLCNSGYRIQ